MKRSDFPSLAEYYRAHRAAFELALERGCTPAEAEAIIKRRAAKAAEQRLKAKLNAPIRPGFAPQFEDFDCPYMMRN